MSSGFGEDRRVMIVHVVNNYKRRRDIAKMVIRRLDAGVSTLRMTDDTDVTVIRTTIDAISVTVDNGARQRCCELCCATSF